MFEIRYPTKFVIEPINLIKNNQKVVKNALIW